MTKLRNRIQTKKTFLERANTFFHVKLGTIFNRKHSLTKRQEISCRIQILDKNTLLLQWGIEKILPNKKLQFVPLSKLVAANFLLQTYKDRIGKTYLESLPSTMIINRTNLIEIGIIGEYMLDIAVYHMQRALTFTSQNNNVCLPLSFFDNTYKNPR